MTYDTTDSDADGTIDADVNNTNTTTENLEATLEITDAAGVAHTGELADASDVPTDTRTDVSDSGTTVVTDVTDINFSSNVSVTDDGDGSVTVTSTDTDTQTDVSDSSGTVVSETGDITFTASGDASLSVTADGDGTATVDVSATDTDTQTDVSDGGTQVVASTGDINFGSNLNVSDDGDGTVTVSADDAVGDNYSLSTQTTDYTASDEEIVLADASGGAITITLPSPTSDLLCVVKKIDGANTVTVATPGTETIDGQSSLTLDNQYTAREFTSDGSNYFII